MLTASVTFALAAILIVLLPGPDTLVVLRNLVRGGRRGCGAHRRRRALRPRGLGGGRGPGHGRGAARERERLSRAAVVGAVYLIWLGVQTLRARIGADAHPGADLATPPARPLLGRGFGAGLATELLNPKVGVFFVTSLPGFVRERA